MKKLTFSLLASLALFQTVLADAIVLPSRVNLSLQHYEVLAANLGTNPEFQNIISEGEFITDIRIQRRSVNITEGNVYVTITTQLPTKNDEIIILDEAQDVKDLDLSTRHRRSGYCKNKSSHTKRYVATLLLTPSDAGTPSITVVSIDPDMRCRKPYGCKGKKPADTISSDLSNTELSE